MTRTYRYFAYGSNMSSARLQGRTPSARFLARGRIRRHALRWHKLGRDGSGKCDATFTDDVEDTVWGVLFELDHAEKSLLDAAEGLGIGYVEKVVAVTTNTGTCNALTYEAKPDMIDASLRPRAWYKAHVVRGAQEHGLPTDYVAMLEAVATTPEGSGPLP